MPQEEHANLSPEDEQDVRPMYERMEREMLLHPPEERLTEEERQLIAANQLGVLLHVYRPKAGFIRVYRGLGITLDVMVILGLALVLLDVSQHWSWSLVFHPDTSITSPLDKALIFMPFLFALVGAVFANILAARLPRQRVMLFEQGLFLRRDHVWKRDTQVLRWDQMTHLFPERGLIIQMYVLWGRGGKKMRLESTFQDFETLIAEIRQHMDAYG